MADKTDDLVIGVSTDLTSVQRAIRKLDADIARASSGIERQFATIGKSIDRAMPTAVQDRINKMVGIQTAATKEWMGAMADQGKEMERLRARFSPMFATINSYKSALGEIRAAHRLGAISADEMASAIQRERQAALSSIAAIKQRNAALSDAPNIRGGAGTFNTSNLAAQGFDIAATAGFMPWYTVALQQGPQVAQVFNDIRASGAAIGPAVSAAFMQLVNPISLVTIGVIAASAAAIQYGMDVFTATEDSAEALQKQATLIKQVADRWGEAYPAIKAYSDELQKAREQAELLSAIEIVKKDKLKNIPVLIEQMSIEMADFVSQLRLAGEEDEQIVKLQNAVNAAAEKMRDGKDATSDLNDAMSVLKNGIENTANPAVQSMIDLLGTLLGVSQKTAEAVANVVNSAAKVQAQVQNAIQASTFRDNDGTIRQTNQFVPRSAPTPDRRPSELSMYPNGTWKKGGSSTLKKTADDRFFEDIEAIKQRSIALAEERAQLGLSYEAQQKRKTAFELEQKALKDAREEARKKGDQDWQNAQLTPEQVRQIDEVSAAYARQADELRKAQNNLVFQKDLLRGGLGDLKSALADGKLEWEELGEVAVNALDKITDKLLDDVVNAIFEVNRAGSTSGSGGFLGFLDGLFGGGGGFKANTTLGNYLMGIPGFDGGGNTGPGSRTGGLDGKGGFLAMLHPQETVTDHTKPTSIDVRAPRFEAGVAQGAITAPVSINIDATGADAAGLARVETRLAALQRDLPGTIVKTVQDAQKRRGL